MTVTKSGIPLAIPQNNFQKYFIIIIDAGRIGFCQQ